MVLLKVGSGWWRPRTYGRPPAKDGRDTTRGANRESHSVTASRAPIRARLCPATGRRYNGTPMPFDLQPTLTGDLLELRPLRAADSDALYAVASDPLIWEQHPDSDRWKPDVFREFFRVALESGGALVAIDKKEGRIVGSSRYHDYRPA